jgi:hypothetical protein
VFTGPGARRSATWRGLPPGSKGSENPACKGVIQQILGRSSANKRRKRELEGTEENLASLPYIELPAFMAELRARKGTTARMKNRLGGIYRNPIQGTFARYLYGGASILDPERPNPEPRPPPDFSLTALLRSCSTPWRRRISFSSTLSLSISF